MARATKYEKGNRWLNDLLSSYKTRAKKYSYEFELTKEQFKELISRECSYCGRQAGGIHGFENKTNQPLVYSGIDRKNPTIGYTIENSVPCCKQCNYGKHNLQYEEWTRYLDDLVKFRSPK